MTNLNFTENKLDNSVVNPFKISLRRRISKYSIIGLMGGITFLMLLPLFWILYEIINQGLPVILNDFPRFFVNNTSGNPRNSRAGAYNAIYGSLLSILVGSIFGLAIGILAGIYLAESSDRNQFANIARFITNVLSGLPSIVAGLIIYTLYVKTRKTDGYGAFPAGLALSLLMIPMVTRVTEEGIRTVPLTLKEAGLALGIPNYRIMISIIIKTSKPVVLTGIMLSISRILGETAPLIFTTGDTNILPRQGNELTDPTATLTLKIFNYSLSAFRNWISIAWGMALVLIIIILIINIVARTSLISSVLTYLKKKNLKLYYFSKILVISILISVITIFLYPPLKNLLF